MSQSDVNIALAELTERRLRLLGGADERRRTTRMRVIVPVPARFGRVDVTLVDLSDRGARMRHRQPLHPGSEARLTFDWGMAWFNANARILSSRLVTAGETQFYESRIYFLEIPPDSKKTLEQVVGTLRDIVLRKWVGNMMGEILADRPPSDAAQPRALLRFRLLNGHWIVRTADEDEPQPADGFILPASMGEEEIKTVCGAYKQLDVNGRQLLRLFAAASVADTRQYGIP